MKKQLLLNTYINNVTMPETIEAIEHMIHKDGKSYVVAINVDVVMKIENDPYLKKLLTALIWFWLTENHWYGFLNGTIGP